MIRIKAFLTILFLLLTVALQAAAGPFTLVIDPGHGGNDPGAVGQKTKEKTINLNVALALGKLIEANCKDVKVIYTRKTDVFVSLQGRADIANKAKANLFISIHTNSAPAGTNASGAETYTLGMHRAADNLAVACRENSVITMESDYKKKYQGFDPNKAESYIIFELMQDKHMAQSVKLAKCIQKQYTACGRRDKGVHQAGFLVLRETSMPSVLTELGFISNPTEEAFLNSSDGINKLARSIYDGFVNYRRQIASLAPSTSDDIPTMASCSADHTNEGATQDVTEDNIPSIRPVKTIPYPSPGTQTTTTPATPKPTTPTTPKAEEPAKPKAEKPKAEEPAKPKTEKPKAEEPAKPKTEKPKTEEPAKPKAEKPKTEEPAKPKTEKPKAEEPAKPKAEKPKAEEPAKPKAEKPKAEEPAKPKAEKPKAEKPTPPAAGKPEFRLQLFTSSSERKAGDASFKGLAADHYKEGDTYKYTYGKTASYEEIVNLKKTIADKFPGVFIIALLDGKRIELQKAIELSKNK